MFSSLNKQLSMKTCTIFILSLIIFSGCTSVQKEPKANSTAQTVTLTQQEYRQLKEMAQQWQENKAGIERLLAYEQTLGVLVKDLNRLVANNDKANFSLADNNKHKQDESVAAENKQNKALISQPTPSSKAKKEDVVITLFKADKPVREKSLLSKKPETISLETLKSVIKSSTAKYAVQVASVKSRKKAKQVYETLKVKLVGSKHTMQEARLEPKQIGQQQFYRLKLGAFETKEQAQSACSQWQKYQVNCFVAQFGGLNKGDWL
jgi:uncharacterized protein YceK